MAEPVAVRAGEPLEDMVGEGRRLVDAATRQGITVRLLGGVGVYLQGGPTGPLLPRPVGDIDLAIKRGGRGALTAMLTAGDYVADICARDWGLWRTATATIARCKSNLADYALSPEQSAVITDRLDVLRGMIEQAPKSGKWRLRSRVGDRVRWYAEPEENTKSD
jgi:hypothetical protein